MGSLSGRCSVAVVLIVAAAVVSAAAYSYCVWRHRRRHPCSSGIKSRLRPRKDSKKIPSHHKVRKGDGDGFTSTSAPWCGERFSLTATITLLNVTAVLDQHVTPVLATALAECIGLRGEETTTAISRKRRSFTTSGFVNFFRPAADAVAYRVSAALGFARSGAAAKELQRPVSGVRTERVGNDKLRSAALGFADAAAKAPQRPASGVRTDRAKNEKLHDRADGLFSDAILLERIDVCSSNPTTESTLISTVVTMTERTDSVHDDTASARVDESSVMKKDATVLRSVSSSQSSAFSSGVRDSLTTSCRDEARNHATMVAEYYTAFRDTLVRNGVRIDEKEALERACRHVELQQQERLALQREARRYHFEGQQRSADRRQRHLIHQESQHLHREERDWVSKLVSARQESVAAVGSAGVWSATGTLGVRLLEVCVRMRDLGLTGLFWLASDAIFGECSTATALIHSKEETYWYITALQGVTSYVPFLEEGTCYIHRSSAAVSGLILLGAAILLIQRFPQAAQNTVYTFMILLAPVWTGVAPVSNVAASVALHVAVWAISGTMFHVKFCTVKKALKGNGCRGNPSSRDVNEAVEWFDSASTQIRVAVPLAMIAFEASRTLIT